MSKVVIVFSFPEPEDNVTLGRLIAASKAVFAATPDVKVRMGYQ